MKRCLTSAVIRKMQIKTTSYQSTLIRMATISQPIKSINQEPVLAGMWRKWALCTAGRNAKQCSRCGKQYTLWQLLEKWTQFYHSIQQLHLFVHTHKGSKEGLEHLFAHSCSQQHYSQQLKSGNNLSARTITCPNDEFQINKTWSVQTGQRDSSLKRKDAPTPATTWVNLKDVMLGEISQTDKDKIV